MSIYNPDTGDLNIPDGYALHLGKIGVKYPPGRSLLDELVPERRTHIFALDPRKWIPTYWSLTGKDQHKVVHYKPSVVEIVPGTLVADMRYANRYLWSGDEHAARRYARLVLPYEEANIDEYHLPELLIPARASRRLKGRG
jgi:hypothetical protein